ncbi:rho GTPase-activating protein 28 isoform X2 [Cynoglossus semilaevis]|uniref:rho GTPase-activating protein 28 isoform X2 n=1 Tax=Cynoglossus semilaevis TaxID=244447 RepID=UPI000D6270FF|nr:rho GTPase-activating protein 18 isoform X2 [Cynoglossus semilaevis]
MLSSTTTTTVPISLNTPRDPSLTVTPTSHHVAMQTYWTEVESIEEEREEEEEESKSVDEVDMEEAWLMGAGLSSLVTGSFEEDTSLTAEALLSTLTRQQAATVKNRLDNYNETLRKKNRQPVKDVRDIFTQSRDDPTDSCSSPTSEYSQSPTRYHVTTKTIRRTTQRVRPSLHSLFFDAGLMEDADSVALSPLPPHTQPPPVTQSRQADWLVRDSSYSDGVDEHKQGGACWDCLHSQGDDNSDVPFVPIAPSQGLTCTDDLSSCDLTQLSFISHIELSTFLFALGIQSKETRQPRHRSQDTGVFGVPLKVLLENDRKKFPGVKVPVVFQKLLCIVEQTGLQTEGILRVPGSAARVKHLRKEIDRTCGTVDWSTVTHVEAAALLKLFIRELPTHLLTHSHLGSYQAVLRISSVVHQVQALQLLTLLLPEENRQMLRALLLFLRQVVSHQDHNRMSLWNVSLVMAPNLFTCCHRHKQKAARQLEEMEDAVGGAQLVRLMITHQELLWTVPKFLLSQVRQVNQVSGQKQFGLSKAKRRLLRRKNDKNHRDQVSVVFIQTAFYWRSTGSILTVIG